MTRSSRVTRNTGGLGGCCRDIRPDEKLFIGAIGDNSHGGTERKGVDAGDQCRWRSGQVAVEAGVGHVDPPPRPDKGMKALEMKGEKSTERVSEWFTELTQKEDAVTDPNVDAMLIAGVIEEDNEAWGFPVVLVCKNDGEARFCVDYRALNKIMKKNVYPLPPIDETLEALGGALAFTTLDLRGCYWQIREDRDKIVFTTNR
ncbi:unnamed protein product [Phytophthora fragariaefolia]|uniref:Unnamed protein product n=1 Tax=Phytophthora fragariaefolia TaxID=1490495 RepID=A0A9W6YCZ6_9STRA|nr:unnamed protein product [Phytophthora fragariaefolia]